MVCCVPKCTVNQVDKQRSFPASKYLRQRWIRAIRVATGDANALNGAPVRNKTICQWHFKHADVQAPTRFRIQGIPTETELAACRLCLELDRAENLMPLEELFIRGVPVVRILATLVDKDGSVHNSISNICARCLAYLDVLYSVQKHFHGLAEDSDRLQTAVDLYKAAQTRSDGRTAAVIKQEVLENVETYENHAESPESWNSISISRLKASDATPSLLVEQLIPAFAENSTRTQRTKEHNKTVDLNQIITCEEKHNTIDGLYDIMAKEEYMGKVDPGANNVDNCVFAVYKGMRDSKLANSKDDTIIIENHVSGEFMLMDMFVTENSSIDCSADGDMMASVVKSEDNVKPKRRTKAKDKLPTEETTTEKPVIRRRGRKPNPKPAVEKRPLRCYDPDVDVTCYLCYRPCANVSDMMEHLSEHADRDLQCELCKQTFHNILHLNRHMAKHDPLTRPYKCNYCEIRYATHKSQRRHERQVHSRSSDCLPQEKKKPKFVCHLCGNQFASKGTLRDHEDLHLGIKRFPCDVCGMQFRNRSIRERHKMAHTSVVMYKCDLCGRGFRQSTVYKDHLRFHAKETIYRCNLCDTGFTSSSNLRRHKIRNHYKTQKQTVDVPD